MNQQYVAMTLEPYPGYPISQIEIFRPQRMNGIGPTIVGQLHECLDRLDNLLKSKGNRVVSLGAASILSRGKRIWIGGGDLKELSELDSNQAKNYANDMELFSRRLNQSGHLFVTWINGLAIGGGAELASMADLRFCSDESAFHWKQLQVGLPLGYGTTERLSTLVGESVAKNWIFRCKSVSAVEAKEKNFVHDLFDSEDEFINELKALSKIDPAALLAQKKMFHSKAEHSIYFANAWKNPAHLQTLKDFS